MSLFIRVGVAATAFYGLFLAYVMYRMSMGEMLADPTTWLFLIFAVAPTAFALWRGQKSGVWLLALVPMIMFGAYEAYIMGLVSTSSTTAIGWFIFPLMQWAFVGLVAAIEFWRNND